MELSILEKTFEERKTMCKELMESCVGRIPVLLKRGQNAPKMNRYKFMVPDDFKLHSVLLVIRKRITIDSQQGIFLSCRDIMLNTNKTLSEVYDLYKERDGLLIITYHIENVFGWDN